MWVPFVFFLCGMVLPILARHTSHQKLSTQKFVSSLYRHMTGKKRKCVDDVERPLVKRRQWTGEETNALLEGVSLHGEDWTKVASYVGTRNEGQCYERFKSAIRPYVGETYARDLERKRKYKAWTKEEDAKLVRLRTELGGNHWTTIALEMPGRSHVQIKNRWHCCLKPKSSGRRKTAPKRRVNVPKSIPLVEVCEETVPPFPFRTGTHVEVEDVGDPAPIISDPCSDPEVTKRDDEFINSLFLQA